LPRSPNLQKITPDFVKHQQIIGLKLEEEGDSRGFFTPERAFCASLFLYFATLLKGKPLRFFAFSGPEQGEKQRSAPSPACRQCPRSDGGSGAGIRKKPWE
jgi:hypothetical protein